MTILMNLSLLFLEATHKFVLLKFLNLLLCHTYDQRFSSWGHQWPLCCWIHWTIVNLHLVSSSVLGRVYHLIILETFFIRLIGFHILPHFLLTSLAIFPPFSFAGSSNLHLFTLVISLGFFSSLSPHWWLQNLGKHSTVAGTT